MKIIHAIVLLLCLNVYSQDSTPKIDSIIQTHVEELRAIVGKDAYVFIDFRYDFPNENIILQERDLVIIHGVEAKMLKKNKEYFLVRFTLRNNHNGGLMLMGVNFRVKKINRNSVNLINLGNGNDYKI